MGGQGSGPQKQSKNRADAMRSLTNKLPMAIDVILETAEGTNKDRLRYEAAVEIKDSVQGKPKVQVEVPGVGLLAWQVAEIFAVVAEARRKQLTEGIKEGQYAIQGQGEGQGVSQGLNEEEA